MYKTPAVLHALASWFCPSWGRVGRRRVGRIVENNLRRYTEARSDSSGDAFTADNAARSSPAA